MSDPMKSIKIVEFNNKEDEYIMWEKKFMSVSTTRGYQDVFLGKIDSTTTR